MSKKEVEAQHTSELRGPADQYYEEGGRGFELRPCGWRSLGGGGGGFSGAVAGVERERHFRRPSSPEGNLGIPRPSPEGPQVFNFCFILNIN